MTATRKSSTTQKLVACATVLIVIQVWPGSGASLASTGIVLGEHNTITGSESGVVDVVIPRDVMVESDFFETPEIAISGNGRIVGLALIERDEPARKAFQLYSTRWSFCGHKGCEPGWSTTFTFATKWKDEVGFPVPAGEYRLYLIADGAPLTIELTMEELAGATSLTPTGPGARLVQPRNSGPSAHAFSAFGPRIKLNTPAMLMAGDYQYARLGLQGHAETSCHWRVTEEGGPHEAAPGPHCVAFSETWSAGGGWGGGAMSIGAGRVAQGTWRSSYWAANATARPETRFMDLWVPFPES